MAPSEEGVDGEAEERSSEPDVGPATGRKALGEVEDDEIEGDEEGTDGGEGKAGLGEITVDADVVAEAEEGGGEGGENTTLG